MRKVALVLASVLLSVSLITACKPPPGGYWTIRGQVWVGLEAPEDTGWYTPGENREGKPFWVRRGSAADLLLRRHGGSWAIREALLRIRRNHD